ncbi:MAG: cyclic pyranopterin monophosphate synthase MoaC [Planctomycetes bacterium]|nr:cyclic pyranopterin monophosphate synthase MoaC [Planctomycetota bacterium]
MAQDTDSGDSDFTHWVRTPGGDSHSRMVDVGHKPASQRSATARARVRFPGGILARLLEQGGPKGPILEVSRVAGILASKRTSDLIPMCHPLGLDSVEIRFRPVGDSILEIECQARVLARTGVEMEAMVGASLAGLTVYDMCKGVHKGIVIESIELLEKSGGKSGTWRSSAAPAAQEPG